MATCGTIGGAVLGLWLVGCGGAGTAPPAREPPSPTEVPSPAPSPDGSAEVSDAPLPQSTEPPGAPGGEPSAADCTRPESFGPVLMSPERHAHRNGARARQFADAPTTKDNPLEECGLQRSLQRLLQLTCSDGTNPFASAQAAHRSRAGNLGPGGRCGSIIDLYRVPCPEREYEIHVDMYVCAAEGA